LVPPPPPPQISNVASSCPRAQRDLALGGALRTVLDMLPLFTSKAVPAHPSHTCVRILWHQILQLSPTRAQIKNKKAKCQKCGYPSNQTVLELPRSLPLRRCRHTQPARAFVYVVHTLNLLPTFTLFLVSCQN